MNFTRTVGYVCTRSSDSIHTTVLRIYTVFVRLIYHTLIPMYEGLLGVSLVGLLLKATEG